MGKLTPSKALAEPGRYSDGDGLFLELNGKDSGRWLLRVPSGGRRREIGLGSLRSVSLADAREAAFLARKRITQESIRLPSESRSVS
ncbi:Arm DNA-binding domain-containing protein [Sphingomonas psychrotolerans]|uniref:Arm DNA-binding domain-containing protein n=1 Tax=Sphingomonas psychrotolerans TaxID=1327635 RepID=UPI003899B35D